MKQGRLVSVLVSLVLVSCSLTGVVIPSSAAASYPVINRESKESVKYAYDNWYVPLLGIESDWNGDVDKCRSDRPIWQPAVAVGSVSAAYQQATFDAVNYYRSMGGLMPVTESKNASAVAQQTALMMHGSYWLSHRPHENWQCYSAKGREGAERSNLSTEPGPMGIHSYMEDSGVGLESVGHRMWIMSPTLSSMGSGSTSEANALYVFGEDVASNNPPAPNGVGWPSNGYFPYEILPGGDNRWSYALSDADFTHATVKVTKNGATVSTTIVDRTNGGSIVWEMPRIIEPAHNATDSYQVTITGAKPQPIAYTVKLFQAGVLAQGQVSVTGTAQVGKTLSANTSGWPSGTSFLYEWLRDGRDTGSYSPDGKYTIVAEDVGSKISVRVTAGKTGYNDAVRNSTQTSKVVKGRLSMSKPTIVGQARVNSELAVKYRAPAAINNFSFQWYANNQPVRGEVYESLTVTKLQSGKRISVRVTPIIDGYEPFYVMSDQTPIVGKQTPRKALSLRSRPKIAGASKVGRVLRANKGIWNTTPSRVKFQWLRNGKVIRGATKSHYRLKTRDRGTRFSLRVIVMKSGYFSGKAVSSKTSRISR